MQYIGSPREAEENAAKVLRRMGFRDAATTPVGPDGGIDVVSSGALAQVKWQGARVGRPDVQRLYGARGRNHHKRLFFFAASGYTEAAIGYANEQDIALYTFDPTGAARLVNTPSNWRTEIVADDAPAVFHPLASNLPDLIDPDVRRALVKSFRLKDVQDTEAYALVQLGEKVAMLHQRQRLGIARFRRKTYFWMRVTGLHGIWLTGRELDQARMDRNATGEVRIIDAQPDSGDLARLSVAAAFMISHAINRQAEREVRLRFRLGPQVPLAKFDCVKVCIGQVWFMKDGKIVETCELMDRHSDKSA
ncbi:restriction endonuclease [Nocardia asteroides]|uniref:restriction endonuclease n=1 Tax=Nocardia asteroides TaxID=1824 RepID=UPI0037C69193